MPAIKNATADSAPPPAPAKPDFSEIDAAIDALPDDPATSETPAPAPAPKAPPPEPDATPTETPEPEPTPATGSLGEDLDGLVKKTAPKSQEVKTATEIEDKRPPKALRDELSRVKGELTKHTSRVKELETAVAKAADEGRRAAETALQAKLDKLTAEREELATKVRYLNFAESDDYKERFVTPYRAALKGAAEEIEGMTVENAEGVSRPLGMEDVMALVDMPAAEARRRAAELFGAAAPDIMRHRAKIRELGDSARNAVKEWREKGSKLQEEQAAEVEAAQKEFAGMVDGRVKELGELAPDIFGENGKDPEVQGYVEKARAVVDVALGRTAPRVGTSPREAAVARAKAIGDLAAAKVALPRVLHERNKYKADLDAALEKLKGYEKSEPTTETPAGKKTIDDPLDWAGQIEGLADVD